jgi:hypothetical protein
MVLELQVILGTGMGVCSQAPPALLSLLEPYPQEGAAFLLKADPSPGSRVCPPALPFHNLFCFSSTHWSCLQSEDGRALPQAQCHKLQIHEEITAPKGWQWL